MFHVNILHYYTTCYANPITLKVYLECVQRFKTQTIGRKSAKIGMIGFQIERLTGLKGTPQINEYAKLVEIGW